MSISVAEKYLEQHLVEVSASEFYRTIFPVGSFEQKGVYVDGGYNGILLRFNNQNSKKPTRITVTDDLEALAPSDASSDCFSVMSPVSYCGKSRKFANARYMYALAIDLDGLTTEGRVKNLFWQIENQEELRCFYWGLPVPTYLVSSGTGIHIYYVFEQPIPMFDDVVKELEKLKKRLTWQAWTQGSSALHDKVQYEPLNQAFRCVGTITKNNRRVRAFKWGNAKKTTIEKLNESVPEDEKYRALINGNKVIRKKTTNPPKKGSWTTKRDLYDWWLRRLPSEAEEGHRYWCVHMLAVYAIKAGIDYKELKKDAYMLQPILDKKSSDGNPFTKKDVYAALKGYKEEYRTYPINSIVYRTGLPIEKNIRKGRKQVEHLRRARITQLADYPNGEWRNKDGRPKGSGTKKDLILNYKNEHPKANHSEIARALGVSRPTVIKWLSNTSSNTICNTGAIQ